MRFYSESILSKWGFEDGDILTNILLDNDFDVDRDVSDRILSEIVKIKMLPVIKQDVEVFLIGGHNPIRASHVDGVEINPSDIVQKIKLVPEFVDVEDLFILELAASLVIIEDKD